MRYWIRINKDSLGPFTPEQVLNHPQVTEGTLVYPMTGKSGADWKRMRDVPELSLARRSAQSTSLPPPPPRPEISKQNPTPLVKVPDVAAQPLQSSQSAWFIGAIFIVCVISVLVVRPSWLALVMTPSSSAAAIRTVQAATHRSCSDGRAVSNADEAAAAAGIDGKVDWAAEVAESDSKDFVQAIIARPGFPAVTLQWRVNLNTGIVEMSAASAGDKKFDNAWDVSCKLTRMMEGR